MKRGLAAAMMGVFTGLTALCTDYSHATLTTTLPGADESVTYEIDLFSEVAPADTLAPFNYLIEWTSESPAGQTSRGFSAYFNGRFYRGNDTNITAYDFDIEPERFAPGGDPEGGIQNTEAFLDLIPAVVISYTRGRTDISDSRGDVELSRSSYVYDSGGRPVSCRKIISPDTRQEQMQTIGWTYPDVDEISIDLPTLQLRHPDEFAALEVRAAGVAGLPGRELPGFNAPASDGRRYDYTVGEGFRRPMVIIAMDEATTASAALLGQVCDACHNAGVMAIFKSNRMDRISDLTKSVQPDITLYSARKALRQLGITRFPTIIVVDRDGIVRKVLQGENNNAVSDVISILTELT